MKCRHCAVDVQEIDYGTGPVWLHHDPGFPMPYQICKPAPIAEPDTVGAWARRLLDPQKAI